MGKSTISMAMFNSYVSLPEGIFQRHRLRLPITDKADVWGHAVALLELYSGRVLVKRWVKHPDFTSKSGELSRWCAFSQWKMGVSENG